MQTRITLVAGLLGLTGLTLIGLAHVFGASRSTTGFSTLSHEQMQAVHGGAVRYDDHWTMCVTSVQNYWCESSGGATACPAACGTCSKCSTSAGNIYIQRCIPNHDTHTLCALQPGGPSIHNCGQKKIGTCGATGTCVPGTWTSCAIGGGSSMGDCPQNLVVDGCN